MGRAARRLPLLAGLWWLLAGDDGRSWLFAAPVLLAVAAWPAGAAGPPGGRLQLLRLPVFIPLVLWRSLAGSCDVAWRAVHRRLPIDPVLLRYPLRLPAGGPARVFFANCLNLLPGTLTACWDGGGLRIHVLTDSPHTLAELRELERQVALLFGHRLGDDAEDADS